MPVRGRRALILAVLGVAVALGAIAMSSRLRAGAESERRWALIRARGGLRIGIDPGDKRFSFFTAEGWQGFDADLAREISRRLGLALWIEPVGFDGIYDALRSDRVDVSMSALLPDPAQTADFAYSEPYFEAGLALAGGCPRGEAVPSCLSGARVSVALGSDADRLARLWERRVPGLARLAVADDVAALSILGGGADAALVDGREMWPALRRLGAIGQPVAVVVSQPYVLGVRRGDSRLLAELNALLSAMQADGTLEALGAKWLGDANPGP